MQFNVNTIMSYATLPCCVAGGGGGGAGGAEGPLNENFGGSAPPRFGRENIGNATENWFGKIFVGDRLQMVAFTNGRAWRNIIF